MRESRYWTCITIMLASCAVICGLSLTLARHGFDEYDMSPMIDSGWRVFSGQAPGRDFLITFPPSVYLLTALFFRFFGVTWHAMSLGACLVYVAMLLLGLRVSALVRNTQGTFVAVWTAYAYGAALTIPFIIMNVIWHSELAMDFSIYASMPPSFLRTMPPFPPGSDAKPLRTLPSR